MTKVITRAKSLGQRLRNRLFGYLPNRRGNVAIIVALSLAPLAGVMGLAMEGANWLLINRSEQNAADASVVAAANQALQDYYNNNDVWKTASTDPYTYEGKAVAKNFGYTSNGVDMTVAVNTTSCPGSFSNPSGFTCFQVTITKTVPLYLTRLVGFNPNGNGKEVISATALSGAISVPAPVCFTDLAHDTSSGNSYSFVDNGLSMDLAGCPIGTNGGSKCSASSSSTLVVPYIVIGNDGSDKNACSSGDVTLPTSDFITDPYVSLDSSIPTSTSCGGSSLTGSSATTTLNSSAGSGTTSCPLVHIISGDLTLTTDVKNVTGDQIWVINNGVLNLNGFSLCTGGCSAGGSGGLAIIFTGGPPSSSTMGSAGYIQGAGTLDISSLPAKSGTFSGVTLYQDPTPWGGEPATGTTYSATYDGSKGQTWDLSGIIYFPNADWTLNGAMGKADNGYSCFNWVSDTSTVNGGGGSFSLFSNPLSQCTQQGSNEVETYGYRFALVQ